MVRTRHHVVHFKIGKTVDAKKRRGLLTALAFTVCCKQNPCFNCWVADKSRCGSEYLARNVYPWRDKLETRFPQARHTLSQLRLIIGRRKRRNSIQTSPD